MVSRFRLLSFIACSALAAPIALADDSAAEAPVINDTTLVERLDKSVAPLLQKHCYDCHSGDEAEAGVDLTRFKTLEDIRNAPSVWEQVRGLIRIGAMPPPDSSSLPTDEERAQMSQWILETLHYVDCNECYAPAPITVRRLNAVEYDHAIRDLTGVDMRASREIGFVTDEVGNGFDNQGEVLTVSPLVLEKFFLAARFVAKKAIILDRLALKDQRKSGSSIDRGRAFDAVFDVAAGKYEISARMEFGFEQNFSVNAQLQIDGEMVEEFEVPAKRQTFKWNRELTEGEHTISIFFVDNEKIGRRGGERRKIRLDYISIDGPEVGDPRYPIQHRSIVVANPSDSVSVADAAHKVAENLLLRAYRRPPAEELVQSIADTIKAAVDRGDSFEKGVQEAIEVVLVSPDFFFRIEHNSGIPVTKDGMPQGVELVDNYDLASRLSFYLWSSIPDQELLNLAADGSLQKPEVINQQIDRMLDDPRAETGIVGQFFGQWLGLRSLSVLQVDTDEFPTYNSKLSDSMIRETTLFCVDTLRHGKLIDLLASEHTFVNPRLAELYGLEYDGKPASELYRGGGRDSQRNSDYTDENRFIKVPLNESRKGLLTQASILTLTSNPNRTSPVKRGKWVLENIIGDPPPPAPPGVPALEDAGKGKDLSLREQLEIHRANPSCASCHKVMDPIGLGLENFNAVGQYREKDGKNPIDAAGQLADGRQFNGSKELLTYLLTDEEKFARHFTGKLLTFALGRALVRQDACAIDKVLEATKPSQYNMRELIKAVALSEPFRYRVATVETAE